MICRLRGPLDLLSLRRAIEVVSQRHEALRTTFIRRGRQVLQQVHQPRHVPFEVITVAGPAAYDDALLAELRTPIDAATWPVRVRLWRVDDDDHLLCFNQHHLVSDGASGSIVFHELSQASRPGAPPLPPPPPPYRAFAAWQHAAFERGELQVHEAYWRRHLTGVELPPLPFADHPDGSAPPRCTAYESVALGATAVERLRAAAREHKTTLFTVALACYLRLLHERTGRRDLAVASIFANRNRPEFQSTIGFLANVVVLRATVPDAPDLGPLVRATHACVMDAIRHQALPYHLLAPGLVAAGNRRADDLVFQMLGQPMDGATLAGARAELIVPLGIGSRFELELSLVMREGALHAVVFYNAARLERAWIRPLLERYAELCRFPEGERSWA